MEQLVLACLFCYTLLICYTPNLAATTNPLYSNSRILLNASTISWESKPLSKYTNTTQHIFHQTSHQSPSTPHTTRRKKKNEFFFLFFFVTCLLQRNNKQFVYYFLLLLFPLNLLRSDRSDLSRFKKGGRTCDRGQVRRRGSWGEVEIRVEVVLHH